MATPEKGAAALAALESGFRLLQTGRFAEALQLLRQVVEVLPAEGRAWLGLGFCNFKLGDHRRATEAFAEARLWPGGTAAAADIFDARALHALGEL